MSRRDERPEVLGINRRNLDLVFADYRPGKFRVLDDKLAAKALLEKHGIAVPRTLGVIRSQDELDALPDLLESLGDLVVKPAKGWGGRGILVLGSAEPGPDGRPRWVKPGGQPIEAADIVAHVSDVLSGIYSLDEDQDHALLEERIFAHEFHARLYERGLSDLRIVLDRGRPIQAMCRLPADASDGKANLNSGGVGLGVEIETGRTHGAICKGRDITRHPDSGHELIGLQLPCWSECLDLARRCAETVDLDYLGVDLVIDRDRGPLVLEMNARPGLAIQLANREGQRIAARPGPSRFDRLTFNFVWILLAVMALLPFGFELWNVRSDDVVWIDVDPGTVAADDQPAEILDSDLLVTDDEELPLSTTSELFREARGAAAAGDTARARTLYRSALTDSTLAPFALNNLALLDLDAGRRDEAIARLEAAIERYPAYSRGHYNLGLMRMDGGRPEAAAAAFERALELQPSHSGSWANLGKVRFQQRDYAQAREALEQAIRFQPDARNARLRLGLTHRLTGDLAAAQERFAELLALKPGSEAGAYWWARTVMERIRSRDGREGTVSRDSLLIVLAPHLRSGELSARCLSLASCLRWETGDPVGALHGFLRLVEEGYQRSSSRLSAAAVALELGQWSLARELLAQAGDGDYETRLTELARLGAHRQGTGAELETEIWTGLPLADATFRSPDLEVLRLALTGDRAGARRLRTELDASSAWWDWLLAEPDTAGTLKPGTAALAAAQLECDPRHFGQRRLSMHGVPGSLAHWLVGRTARARGDTASARHAEQALEAGSPRFRPLLVRNLVRALAADEPDSARAIALDLLAVNDRDSSVRLALAGLELEAGRPAAALAHWKLLPREVRRGTAARVLKGRIHIADDEPDRGLRELDRALQQDPDHLEARFARGVALFEQDKADEAAEELTAVLNRAPGRSDIRRVLARQLMKERRYADAVAQWERIVRLGAATTSDRFNLALSLQRDDDLVVCLEAYDEVLGAEPDNYKAWYNRSLALDRLGREAEARAGYEHVLLLKPGHEGSLRKLGRPSGTVRGD